jgi:hypothetical protein
MSIKIKFASPLILRFSFTFSTFITSTKGAHLNNIMNSVQNAIAALNQQSTTNDARSPSHRQTKADISSLRNRFESTPTDKPLLQRSSHIETRTTSQYGSGIIRPTSSISFTKKVTPSPTSSVSSTQHDQSYRRSRFGPSNGNITKINAQTSLLEQLEKVTLERDHLKQQLKVPHAPDTISSSSTNQDPNLEMPTLPPGPSSSFWFDVDDDYNNDNGADQSQLYEEFEEIITDYNQQSSARIQQDHRADALQQRLAACQKDTQWMINKYLGDLEGERLYSRSLATIIRNQDELISILETSGHSNMPTPHQHEQQTLLLHSQLELQRMELDDKQEILTLLADERDHLAEKVKQLTHQLLHINTLPHPTEGRQRNHPRTLSTSSTNSLSSYTTTTSILSLSCLDWVNTNNQSTSLTKPPLNRPYSPPQTPPPREKLPPLPMSSTAPITPNTSPRGTMDLSSSSPYTPGSPSIEYNKGQQLTHQNSLPDIRSMHHQHHYRCHGSGDAAAYYGEMEKGIIRQKSFWKGWRQRLSN